MQPRIARRRLAASLVVAAAINWPARVEALAQDVATPVDSTRVGTLVERVAAQRPEALLDRLRTAAVRTPLFPGIVGAISAIPWDDPSDADLATALGGVSLTTNEEVEGSVGNYIVFADAGRATGYVRATRATNGDDSTATPISVENLDGTTLVFGAEFAVSVV